jgi:hypothetical protein
MIGAAPRYEALHPPVRSACVHDPHSLRAPLLGGTTTVSRVMGHAHVPARPPRAKDLPVLLDAISLPGTVRRRSTRAAEVTYDQSN